MTLELYLIRQENKYTLYHNSSKDDSGLEILVKENKKKPEPKKIYQKIGHGFKWFGKKNFDLINKHIKPYLKRLQNKNLRALTASSLVAEVNVNYSENICEDKAEKAFKSIARKEVNRNAAILTANCILGAPLIAACYFPPLTFIPATSLPVILIGIHTGKNIKNARKGMKKVSFVKNKQIALLEQSLESGNLNEKLTDQNLLEYFAEHHYSSKVKNLLKDEKAKLMYTRF